MDVGLDDNTDDMTVEELRALKAKLIEKASKLRDDLQRHENKQRVRDNSIAELLRNLHEVPTGLEEFAVVQKDASKLCDVTESILGVQFKDVDKNWIRDDIYSYKAQCVTKALKFKINLTVDVQENGFTIQELNHDFGDLDQCYQREVAPWVERFAREKQFSYLISGISNYSDQNVLRASILRTLSSNDYISMEKSLSEDGGIRIYVHPPTDTKRIFFEFQWSITFVDRFWRSEHIFHIQPVKADESFVDANEKLLKDFCKIGLSKNDLEDLWTRLCNAIDDVS